MCSVGSSKDTGIGAGQNLAIGGAQGIGAPPLGGGSMLTGARRILARPNTVLGGGGGDSGSGGGRDTGPRNRPGQAQY